MIRRPFIKHHPYVIYNLIVELQAKFNKILEEEAKRSLFLYIIELPYLHELNQEFFDSTGNLTSTGKLDYWKCIDHQIKLLDTSKYDNVLCPWMNRSQHIRDTSMDRVTLSSRVTNNLRRHNTDHRTIWGQAGRNSAKWNRHKY